jgi:hypothetical protein
MSNKTRMNSTLAATCLLLLSTVVSHSAFALSIPGLRSSGAPGFLNEVKVSLRVQGANKRTLSVTGKDGFIFFNGSVLNGTSGMYKLTATFDGAGNLTGGDVTLKGAIDSLGITNMNTLLFSADLEKFGFDPGQASLIGFNTTNIVCDTGLGVVCTTSESVYIELDSMWLGLNTRQRTTGLATTTVPVPAAVWLFGSGLAFLGATARRRRARG